jgi:hypothetical protein
MSNSWHGGKGSKPRSVSDRKKFEDNWDAIFNKKKVDESKKDVKENNPGS